MLAHAFVKEVIPDAADNYFGIITEHIRHCSIGPADLSNLSGMLMFFQSSTEDKTFGRLFDIVTSVCKTLPKQPAQFLR